MKALISLQMALSDNPQLTQTNNAKNSCMHSLIGAHTIVKRSRKPEEGVADETGRKEDNL